MRERLLLYDTDARTKLKAGIDQLANMVKVTLGPKGRNVIIDRKVGSPLITKDGVTVAKEVHLHDPVENMGAQLIRVVSLKTNETAGDGTTTATVIAQALIDEGIKNVTAGANPMDLKRGIDIAVKAVIQDLQSHSREITTYEETMHVASISANNDEEIGKYIATAIEEAGNEGLVSVVEAAGSESSISKIDGMNIDRGYFTPQFINKPESLEVELTKVKVLLYSGRMHQFKELGVLMNECYAEKGSSLLIIADDFAPEVIQTLLLNKGIVPSCAIVSPKFGDHRRNVMNDLAVATGTEVFDEATGFIPISFNSLGDCLKVVVDKNKTSIMGGNVDQDRMQLAIEAIKVQMEQATNEADKQKAQERLSKLTGGIVILHVGAVTETEMKDKKLRIEDALHATRAALLEGILPGGGIALLKSREVLRTCALKFAKGNVIDQQTGVNIVYNALKVPFLSICKNAGVSGDGLLKEIMRNDVDGYNWGYDALEDGQGDMLEMGVVDPTKVVRLTLENAASVASLFLTTEGVIAETNEEKEYVDRLMMQQPR